MSQQLLLDLGTASARSKGQALRHQKLAVAKDDRKARRKLSRTSRLQRNELGIGDVRSQTGCVPAPGPELVEHQPDSIPAWANSINTSPSFSTQATIVPPTSDQTMFSVVSTDNNYLNRHADGQASLYLSNKYWQQVEFPAAVLSTDAVTARFDDDQNEARVIVEEEEYGQAQERAPEQEEDTSIDYYRGLEPSNPKSKSTKQVKNVGMDGQNSYNKTNLKEPPESVGRLDFLYSLKARFQHEPQVYKRFLQLVRKHKTMKTRAFGFVKWVSRSSADHPDLVQLFNRIRLPANLFESDQLAEGELLMDRAYKRYRTEDALQFSDLVKFRLQHEAGVYK